MLHHLRSDDPKHLDVRMQLVQISSWTFCAAAERQRTATFKYAAYVTLCITFRHFPLYISPYYYLPARHRDSEGLIFCRCGFSFSFFFFFRRLISKVTERILTKLGHIFTYDCYLKKMVRTLPGIYSHGLGAKTAFGDWDRLWTLTKKHISATEHDINNRKQSPTCPQIRWTLVQK